MLEHWLIELVGHVAGLSEAQLKQIEKSLPATRALVDLLNRARPIIEQAQSLYAEAEPLIDQAKMADLRQGGSPLCRPRHGAGAVGSVARNDRQQRIGRHHPHV